MSWLKISELQKWFENLGLEQSSAQSASASAAFALVLLCAWIIFIISSRLIEKYIQKWAELSRTQWDDIFVRNRFFTRLTHLIPGIIVYYGSAWTLAAYPGVVTLIQNLTYLYMVGAGLLVISAGVDSMHDIYNTYPVARNRSVKGLVQVFKIFIYILAFGIFISIILQKDLTSFFAGLGAAAAVLMLVFKDTILGFVAGIQLSVNDMVRLGDWIEMPSRGADGAVIDISLNTVKIRNWDQTISTIPPYSLITESFTNWRGMSESGGRRIKRSISIDMKSIHFLSREEIEKFRKIQVIREYLVQREQEVLLYNKEHDVDESLPVNGRRLTNIGTFRAYVEQYLKRHPQIHQEMTFLVRQLQPTDKGLPLEIYVFSKDQRWANYEGIQADIFDHILAVIPVFGLSVYQNPTGEDFSRILSSK